MLLSDIGGEFGFIDRLRATYAGVQEDDLILSVGDDAAVLEVPADRQAVVTTDLLIEGVHFRRDWSDPYSIGWKAAAVNLSDIAAMGADPTFGFVSLALPPDETVEGLERLYDGFCDCLNRYGARLAGGDTNRTPGGLMINVTQMGTVPRGQALIRAGAKVGDILLVTGTLGDSAAGLALLSQLGAGQAEKAGQSLVQTHRRPQPRVVAARAARETGLVHAAMDISDGLAADSQKLCAASGVGARIDAASLPLSEALNAAAEELGLSALDLALDGGEDFELLLAVAPNDVAAVQSAVAATGTSLTAIGEIVRTGFRILAPDGAELPLERRGWDHFAP
ncbi:MAG: thiamine-phosphate kinase [Armatimonadota bacterium]|nr:thiamine-phosphate kinase [Armatimonadota bacterium]